MLCRYAPEFRQHSSPVLKDWGFLLLVIKMLKSLAEFTKTTLIGGILLIIPLYFSIILLMKAFSVLTQLVSPITSHITGIHEFKNLLAILIAIIVCFVAGVIVRTAPGLKAKNIFEHKLLERIPGYTIIRGLTARIAGKQTDETFAVALVKLEDALCLAFVIEEHEDGAFTVFVPSIPTPAVGAVYIMERDRVHFVDVPFTKAAAVISKWGAGAKDLRIAGRSLTGLIPISK